MVYLEVNLTYPPESVVRSKAAILKLCMGSLITKRIQMEPLKNSSTPYLTPHYGIFGGELKDLAKIAQKEKSYDFENWHVVLSNQNKKIRSIKKLIILMKL